MWVVPSLLLIALFITAICYESLLTHPLQMCALYHSGKMFLNFVMHVDYVFVSTNPLPVGQQDGEG